MMNHEFEALIRHPICEFEYRAIENVYAFNNEIRSKHHIASIYIRHGMNAIYAIRLLMDGVANQKTAAFAKKVISEKEIRFPFRGHIITWYNWTTGEVYDGTLPCIVRYAFHCHSFAWRPLVNGHKIRWKINDVCCNIACRFPKLYRPCRAIALWAHPYDT